MKARIWIRWMTLLGWMVLIFLLSHQDGEASAHLSESVKNHLKAILRFFHLAGYGDGHSEWGWIVRKIAHMTEYAILFVLNFRIISLYRPPHQSLLLSVASCLVFALSDEFHQTLIPGRTGTLADVGIDMTGVLVAWIFCTVWISKKPAFILLSKRME